MKKKFLSAIGLTAVLLSAALATGAQGGGPSYTADPKVYKLISENEHFRVIMATWKPGQRDAWHAHEGVQTSYRLTDCQMIAHTPDGKSVERMGKVGEVRYSSVIASHSLENSGKTDCQVLIIEKK